MSTVMQFDQFAGNYKELLDRTIALPGETSEYFAEYKARYLAHVLSRDFSGKALDFGCGVGLLSRFLKHHLPAAQVDGFDVSRDSINRVDLALSTQGLFTSDMDLLARNYDLIVVANVMHHIPAAQRELIGPELASRIAPRGKRAV